MPSQPSNLVLLPLHLASFLIILAFIGSTFFSSSSAHLPFSKYSTPVRTKSTIFTPKPNLEDLSAAGDAAWDALLTPHGGSVWLQTNDTFAQDWGISMFHGLHCLGLIRVGLRTGLGHSSNHHMQRNEASSSHERHLDLDHLQHCFSYIAQHLMCAGDSTIEPPWEDLDANGNVVLSGVDGRGVMHQCKDTSRMWEVARASEKAPFDNYGQGRFQEKDTVEKVWGWDLELRM